MSAKTRERDHRLAAEAINYLAGAIQAITRFQKDGDLRTCMDAVLNCTSGAQSRVATISASRRKDERRRAERDRQREEEGTPS